MHIFVTVILFTSGIYLVLLGLGRKLLPLKIRGREEVRWLGQLLIIISFFSLLSCFGISMHQINEWIGEVLTTGGAGSTG